MVGRSKLVNLDAMIERADFALQDANDATYEQVERIGLRDLSNDSLLANSLRKPDFQRETNHWNPDQVASLIECFVNGDLIPSVILWKSSSYIFVIDGGHRLSVLRAWLTDDYGDGPISRKFFGDALPTEQLQAANLTRRLVSQRIGSWQQMQSRLKTNNSSPEDFRLMQAVSSRALNIQWVRGNAEKAEASFFKINTKGTPLDKIENLLLSNRRKPIAIAARAVIRSGMGHKYWSGFPPKAQEELESLASELHRTLFEPEVTSPIKTLDLPLGGSRGVRAALEVLIDFGLCAIQDQQGNPQSVSDQHDDPDGTETVRTLRKELRLARRITGNDSGSLGLLPAIYFYGPAGRHVSSMFLGTCKLVGQKLANNDKRFFIKFTRNRSKLETALIEQKELIASILQKTISTKRISRYSELLDKTLDRIERGEPITEQTLVTDSQLSGKIFVGSEIAVGTKFSDDTKSAAYLKMALNNAVKCAICGGYLDPAKSVSYDHKVDIKHGGTAAQENCQLSHPFCNQTYKEITR